MSMGEILGDLCKLLGGNQEVEGITQTSNRRFSFLGRDELAGTSWVPNILNVLLHFVNNCDF